MLVPQAFLVLLTLMGSILVSDPIAPQAGVRIIQSGGSTDVQEQGQTTDTYQISLNSIPTGPVNITLVTDGQTQLSTNGKDFFNSISLTLNSTAGATITVRAVDDATAEKTAHLGIIAHTIVSSADPAYSNTNTPVPSLDVNITDNDVTPAGTK